MVLKASVPQVQVTLPPPRKRNRVKQTIPRNSLALISIWVGAPGRSPSELYLTGWTSSSSYMPDLEAALGLGSAPRVNLGCDRGPTEKQTREICWRNPPPSLRALGVHFVEVQVTICAREIGASPRTG